VGDTVKVRGDWHPENLASGRVVAPGEVFDRSALNLDPVSEENPDNDQRLIDEGIVIDAVIAPAQLAGDALQERARELKVPNRANLSADELRIAVAKAEGSAAPATLPQSGAQRAGGEV
jgi:hypothetical protein